MTYRYVFIKRNWLIILLVGIILCLCDRTEAFAYGNSEYEYNHIYPQQYFASTGDKYTFKVKEYEHIWIHNSKGYDNDWNSVVKNIPIIWKIFGSSQIVDNGKIKLYSKRNAAMISGMRHITYSIFLYDYNTKEKSMLLASHFDGISNILYNVSYIASIPAKLVHFSSECFKRGTGLFNGNKKIYGLNNSILMFIWMLWQLIVGLFLAIIGLFIGTIIGILFHPIETFANLVFAGSSLSNACMNNFLVTFIAFLKAIFKPLWLIIFWA